MNPNHLSSAPAQYPKQFRRCAACKATLICEPSPSTALPCKCGGELLIVPVAVNDLIAARERCAAALDRLAEKCRGSADAGGMVMAKGAADHMNALATWMRTEGAQ